MDNHANVSYKEYHENYLSNHVGGGLLDVPFILLTMTLVSFNALYVRCLLSYRSDVMNFLLDFANTILPYTLLLTCLNDHLHICFTIIVVTFLFIITTELFFRRGEVSLSKLLNSKITVKRRPFITNFKSIISLLSVLCILAVDFSVFPTKYIKTEAYGYSLMDTGVGFFVVANGITCKLKDAKSLRKVFVSNVPLLILGVIRYVSTEKINYQKHVSEYGIHWNFFFTLAVVKFLGPYVAAKVPSKWYMWVISLLVHEGILKAGLESWVMGDTPRTDLVSANREGIVSVLGYLNLHVLATHVSDRLVYGSRKPSVKDETKKVFYCIACFFILTAYLHLNVLLQPSRRLANATYVIWMSSICLLVLGISLTFELLMNVICRRRNCGAHYETTIFILEAISTNNLAFFLLGNLLTGAVNMSMNTLFVPPHASLFVITCYAATNTAIISLLYSKKVTMKYW